MPVNAIIILSLSISIAADAFQKLTFSPLYAHFFTL